MLASLKWIKEYADLDIKDDQDLKDFCDLLDLTGTGVEGVDKAGANFDKIVTGQVVEKTKHPDSDHMWVCMVDVGENKLGEDGNPKPLQIVCGAQNFEEGDKIVVSMVGAVLPGDIKIKKSKLRGVVSYGMNCSARELGLGEDHDGIMILPPDTPVGMPFADYLGASDTILDLEITPNRPDCLSIRGLAREFAAVSHVNWKDPLESDFKAAKIEDTEEYVEDEVEVTVEDGDICPRYTACVIKGVKVGPSPSWLVEKLASMGQRSVNNIVDVTNYILFLYGQPLHSFDLDWLKAGQDKAQVVVRSAQEGEVLTTLDGVERHLKSDMTLITTKAAGPVGLAGVMGGLNSEITDNTTNVMLETATFHPGRTSRTSRNLGLFSESSMRYERCVDDHEIYKRALVAACLIREVAGGEILCSKDGGFGLVDVWTKKSEVPTLKFRSEKFCEFVGADIDTDFIVETLKALGCDVKEGSSDLDVVPPTFRPDLEREIDLYEEVLRIYGEDKIKSSLPASPDRVGHITQHDQTRRKIDRSLRGCGLDETISYSFANKDEVEKFKSAEMALAKCVELINPLNSEQAVMRQSLIPGLLHSVLFNQNRGVKRVSLFEIGQIFTTGEDRKLPKEKEKVSGILWGEEQGKSWYEDTRSFDFFDGKGIIENLVDDLNIQKVRYKPLSSAELPFLQDGRIAEVHAGGTLLGWVGEIHPKILRDYDIDGSAVAFELDFAALQKTSNISKPFSEFSDYPSIEVDQNFVVDEDVTCERMMQVITSAGGKLLYKLSLIDIYRDDERVGKNKKSMTFRLVYWASDRTLESAEVDKLHNKVVTKTSGATGAEVRS